MSSKKLSKKYKSRVQESYVPNDIGVEIYCRTWETSRTQPKAIVAFIHGHNEHVSRYDQVFKEFAKYGLMVYGFDQVGCGKTGEKAEDLGGALGLSRVMLDMNEAIGRCYSPNVPLFLMGHSFGGMSVLNYLVMGERRDLIYGAIVASPFVKVSPQAEPDKMVRILLNQLVAVFPLAKIPHTIDSQRLTREKEAAYAYDKDPLIMSRCTLIQIRDVLVEGENFLDSRVVDVHVPRLLLLHGTGDDIASYDATVEVHKKIKNRNRVLRLDFKSYEGAYHDLLGDTIKKEVSQDVASWILEQV